MLKINLQKRTGRKPKIDKDELLSILHSYKNRLFRNGKLDFGGSVWSDIERDMGFKIKKKVYTSSSAKIDMVYLQI